MFVYEDNNGTIGVSLWLFYVIVWMDRTEAMPVCSTVFFQRYRVYMKLWCDNY